LCLGWSVRADKTVELALEALDMAIWRRGQMRAAGAVHHSDQGSQYTSFAFTRRLAAEGLVGNTGTVGDGLDNAMCESLIGTMKIEKLNRQPWRSVEDVRAAVFEWIETWYNRRRRHSSLGYLSPLEFVIESASKQCAPRRRFRKHVRSLYEWAKLNRTADAAIALVSRTKSPNVRRATAGERRCSSVVRRAAHCVSEPCLHRALRVGNARVPGLADKGKDVHIETSV
jgi:hypothetical protein